MNNADGAVVVGGGCRLSAGLLGAHGPPPAMQAAVFFPFAGRGVLKRNPTGLCKSLSKGRMWKECWAPFHLHASTEITCSCGELLQPTPMKQFTCGQTPSLALSRDRTHSR